MLGSGSAAGSLTFGALLRQLRRRAGLTQRELGLAVGYSEAHIARLEGGKRTPDPASVRGRFIEALGIEGTSDAEQLVALATAAWERAHGRLVQGEGGVTSTPLAQSHNLPAPLTSFVGRQQELREVAALITESRLVTLIGSGGAGKTRLALHVAMELLPTFEHGVWWVELTTVTDASLLADVVAAALGLRPTSPDSQAVLTDFLRSKRLMLVLDGCDRVVASVAALAASLLRACPLLTILATSREVLGVPGEVTYFVEGLPLAEAKRLFTERALAARPDLVLDEADEAAIAEICQQLDGIPLAIELAASRVRALTIRQIAERLADRFQLLSSGHRADVPHHQTLRTLIDWSYDLLGEAERTLLRRLGVFVGGWTLEAAEQVCSDFPAEPEDQAVNGSRLCCALPAGSVMEVLLLLVNKSLVIARDNSDRPRYYLLQTIRQYALDKLAESGEVEELRNRHMRFYFELSEQIQPHLGQPEQRQWLERFEAEKDNFRAALAWIADGHGRDLLERPWNGLHAFWSRCGYWAEGFKWLSFLMEHTALPSLRAEAMFGAGFLAWRMGDYESMRALLRTGTDLARRLSDARLIALFKMLSGIATERYEQAREALEEGLRIARRSGLKAETAGLLTWLGNRTRVQKGDREEAARFYEEALALAQEIGDRYREITCLGELGMLDFERGDYAKARAAITRCVEFMRSMGDQTGLADWLMPLGMIAFYQDDLATVCSAVYEGLILQQRFGSGEHLPHFLMLAGSLAHAAGKSPEAVRLLSKASKLRESLTLHNNLEPLRYRELHKRLSAVRAALSDDEFERGWNEGQDMPTQQAVDLALQITRAWQATPEPQTDRRSPELQRRRQSERR
ncbi:MAG: tetratricopeptide repeat protein [Thermoflexales bacterium]|nr:tetratricopeptide repeat protein [Thermoflexales bacterium]